MVVWETRPGEPSLQIWDEVTSLLPTEGLAWALIPRCDCQMTLTRRITFPALHVYWLLV